MSNVANAAAAKSCESDIYIVLPTLILIEKHENKIEPSSLYSYQTSNDCYATISTARCRHSDLDISRYSQSDSEVNAALFHSVWKTKMGHSDTFLLILIGCIHKHDKPVNLAVTPELCQHYCP